MKRLKWLALLVLLVLSLALPFAVGGSTISSLLVNLLLVCGAATAWNIFSGYTGYLSLGHAAYYGIGAYTLAIACKAWNVEGGMLPFLMLPLAGLIGLLFAIPLGWIALKTRQHTFMILTLAIFYIFQALVSNLADITGGSEGMFLPLPTWDASFFDLPFYFAALIIFLLVLFVAWSVHHSKFGLGLRAIRDDEERALGLGVKTQGYKLAAYVLSAFFIAMVGGLAAYYTGSVTPNESLSPTFDLMIVLIVFLGGRGSITGPLVGGMLVIPLQQFLNQQFGASPLESVLYGGVLLVVILLLPDGIVLSLGTNWKSWLAALQKSVTREKQQPQMHTALELSANTISPAAFQVQAVPVVSLEQPATPTSMPRPPNLGARAVPLPYNTGNLPRVKAQRLVPASPAESSISVQEKMLHSTSVSWRCPSCRKPFLLRGNNCYCPRCGIIRSIITNQANVQH